MDKIYEELEEIKVEAQKLREECRAKTELSEHLRKAHIEQRAEIHERKLETEKLAQELQSKSEEICEIRQLYEELQSSFHRKEVFVQQITSANEKLRAEYGEKMLRLEGENKDLVFALDEASARIEDLEKKTAMNDEEIAGLKSLLSVKSEKSFGTQAGVPKDSERKDEYLLKLEEDYRNTQDNMKWKNEQFTHLVEAHKLLKTQFQVSKEEWGKEKSALVDEISSLQTSLDTQIRMLENLKSQIRLCDQALAHERSRRKFLEIEVSESRSQYENVLQECRLAKTEIEDLTMKRDEEVGELRSLLREKEILTNEMRYTISKLEQENKDLLESLKEMQEDQLRNCATSSSDKLRDRIRVLELLHGKCPAKLKEREADLNSQLEKLKHDLEYYLFELDDKNKSIRDIQEELENFRCQLEVKNGEIFVLMMVLKSEFYVAYSKLYATRENLDMSVKELVEKNQLLGQELETKNTELHQVYVQLKQRSDGISALNEHIQSFNSLQEKNKLLEMELKMHKEMLDESNQCQVYLKQQILELENIERQNRKYARDALEKVNIEVANKTLEIEKFKLELQKGKSEVENLKLKLEENQQTPKQENANLLVMLKAQDSEMAKLKEHIHKLESMVEEKSETSQILKDEACSCKHIQENRNGSLESFQGEFDQLKELAGKNIENFDLSDACQTLKHENERLLSDIKERDHKILELEREIESLDVKLRNAEISFAVKESILDDSMKRAKDQNILEIEKKNQIVTNLEKEVYALRKEMALQEETILQSNHETLQLEDSLRRKTNEMEVLTYQFEEERKHFECLIEELESDKQSLLDDLEKSTSYRVELLGHLEGIHGQVGLFCKDNVGLMVILEKMLHVSEEDCQPAVSDIAAVSPPRKSVQTSADERTPLTELNY